MVDVGPGHEGMTAAAQRGAGLFPATLWPLSTTILPTSAGSSGVRSDTLSTRRRYPYPSPSHDPWPGLRPSPDRPVPVRQVLKPVETAPGTLLHDPQHQDGQRFHPRPADPAALSGRHHPARTPGQSLSAPFVAAGSWRPIRIAGMSSLDLTVGLILLMSGAPGRRWVSWTLRMGAS